MFGVSLVNDRCTALTDRHTAVSVALYADGRPAGRGLHPQKYVDSKGSVNRGDSTTSGFAIKQRV